MLNSLTIFSLLFIFATLSAPGRAAPCCGGGALLPSLITGDDQAQLSVSLSHDTVAADAAVSGRTTYRDGYKETTETFKLQGAYLVAESWQLGADLPLVRRSLATSAAKGTGFGIGDPSLSVGYEWLPEYSYSAWRPRGFAFVRAILPLGTSVYDTPNIVDNFGRGFYVVSSGVVLVKTWGAWDAFFLGEGRMLFGRTIGSFAGVDDVISTGWGAGGLLSLGFSPGRGSVRLGVSLSPSFEAAREVTGLRNSELPARFVWTSGFQLGYQISSEWSSSVTYSDQTLVGGAKNNSLSRALSLLIQKRFEL